MHFIFGNVFWGILLLLWGVSLILKGFGIVDLPLVKIFLAVIIIMFGIKILIGNSFKVKIGNEGSTRYVSSSGNDYTTVFGSQNFDLTSLKPDSKPLDITAVFGSIYVELPDDIDFQINATNVFGSVNTPGKAGSVYVNDKPVYIDATAVFGKVEIVYKASTRKPGPTVTTEKDTLQE